MSELVKDYSDVLIAGTPAIAATPASSIVERVYLCAVGVYTDIIVPNASRSRPMPGYNCEVRDVIKYVPATPGRAAVPEIRQTDFRFGWNAGARSVEGLTQPKSGESFTSGFGFSVPRNVLGVAVGLVEQDRNTLLQDYKVGFYFNQGFWQPLQNGVPFPYVRNAYNDGDVFELVLQTGSVMYKVNGNIMFGDAFTCDAPVYLDVAMFSGGDKVVDAQMISGGGQYGVMMPLQGYAYQGSYGRGNGKFAPLRGDGGIHSGQASVMAPLGGVGAWTEKFGIGLIPPLTSSGGGGLFQPSNFGVQLGARIPALHGVGVMRTGFTGGGVARLQAVRSYAYGETTSATQQRGVMAPMGSIGWGFEGNDNATIGAYCSVVGDMQPITNTFVTLHSTGRMLAMFDVTLMVPAQIASQADARSMMLEDVAVLAYIDSVVQAISDAHDQAEGVQVWVLNDRTGAMSQYKNYRFNSFATIGGRYFGADHDGIYLLGGGTDGGEQIETSMRTGMLDLGTTNLKSISNVYLGVASEGLLSVVVETGSGESYRYLARSNDRASMQQRVDTGRGMKSTLYSFAVDGNGGDFELDSMDVNLAASARRI